MLQDGRNHPLRVGHHIGVPKPQHPKAQRLKKLRAPLVVFLRLGMLASIHFDDQFVLKAAKVSKELAQRILAAESGASALCLSADHSLTFGVGRIAAHSAGALTCDRSQPPCSGFHNSDPHPNLPPQLNAGEGTRRSRTPPKALHEEGRAASSRAILRDRMSAAAFSTPQKGENFYTGLDTRTRASPCTDRWDARARRRPAAVRRSQPYA